MPIPCWKCSICHEVFITEAEAETCEARGLPAKIPQGCFVPCTGAPWDNIVLVQVSCARAYPNRRHVAGGSYWTFRDDNNRRPSAIGDTCGSRSTSGPLILGRGFDVNALLPAQPDPSIPAYARAVAFLRSINVEPTVWIDGRAVPAAEPTP